jgi:anti-sigma regulatory factor (Ser/Thr protein kinase)
MTQARTFSADPQSVAAARRFVVEVLSGSPPELLDAVKLMVSELATNVVGHVQTSFELTLIRTAQEVRVEVADHGGGTPVIRAAGPDDPRGRGLRIVEGLADRWGVDYDRPAGKIVWFTVALPAADVVSDQARSGERTSHRSPVLADQGDSHQPPPSAAGHRGIARRARLRPLTTRRA